LCVVRHLHKVDRRHKLKRLAQGEWSSSVTGKTRKQRAGTRVSQDVALHRRMREQSLRTPWKSLAATCEELVRWRSFALWVRAIVDAEGSLAQLLRATLDERCPGFLESRTDPDELKSMWLDLCTWIDDHVFAAASDEGWIDALHYYSGRDPRSEQIWSYWTRTAEAWRDRKPARYPTVDEWHHAALNTHDAQPEPAAALVQQYIEWEAFAFWARLFVERRSKLPRDVEAVIETRCPGFLTHIRGKRPGGSDYSTWFWRQLLAWIESHAFVEAAMTSSLDAVRDAARTHVRAERIAEYWADCSSRWRRNPPVPYPTYEQWLQETDAFVSN
jgi:hypothetical protein